MAEQIEKGNLKFKQGAEPEEVTYQDPCRLGKHMGIFEEPRNVLKSIPGVQFEEMDHSRTESSCCGTSAWTACDKVREDIRIDRLSQAKSTLVTACPKCMVHFSCTQHHNATIDPALKQIRVKDITQLVAEGLESEQ